MGIKNKRAAFFSIDALVAIVLIFIILIMIYPIFKYSLPEKQTPQDLIVSLSSLKNNEINNSLAKSLIDSGVITDVNKSLLEQIGEFYVTNKTLAKEFAASVISTLDIKDNVGIWYEGYLVYTSNSSNIGDAQQIQTARQIISGLREGSSVTGFSARATLSSAIQKKYFYFGGYVGDGNITVLVNYTGNITAAEMELAISTNFTVFINDVNIGDYNQSESEFNPKTYTLPVGNFSSGINKIKIQQVGGQNTTLRISGGFIKISYLEGGLEYQAPTKYYFPGIEGIINIYDGFYVPGQLSSMKVFLHYNSSYQMFLTIGNTTVYNSSSATESSVTIPNANLSSLLNYNFLSNKTVPVRLGLKEILLNGTGGNADVILITDTSGSMDWRLDSDTTVGSVARNCTDASLFNSTTKRISLAKCLDIDFVKTVLSVPGNRMALVSFASSANTFVNLTNNDTLLNSTIMGYTATGGTCVSCALNRAYLLLAANSNSSRKKFIVTMTDGVTNVRSTATCDSLYAASTFDINNIFAGGEVGMIKKKNNFSLENFLSPSATQVNDIKFLNSTFGFAVGNTGSILTWNGSAWNTLTATVSNNLRGLDIYNRTFALAVGDSGKVMRWNGSSWASFANITNSPTLNAISIYNYSTIYIAGYRSSSGRIYRSTNGGLNWTEEVNDDSNYLGVKILNATRAWVVGEGGSIYRWNGASSWTSTSSPTSHDLYDIESLNNTLVFAVGGNDGSSRIIRNTGSTSWTSDYSDATGDSLRSLVVHNGSAYAVGEEATIAEWNITTWKRSFNFPSAYRGNLTTGLTCSSDEDSCSEISSYPALNTNYSSCRVNTELNATVHAIGFGPISTCAFATQTMQNVANCGGGSFFTSSNASQLQEFYNTIANDIIRISYTEQTVQIQGNVTGRIYEDSYIEFSYAKPVQPYGLLISIEKQFDNNLTVNFSIPLNSTIVEATAISYSGARWTQVVSINNTPFYNLTTYGTKYVELGDPYAINIPLSMIKQNNALKLTTSISPLNSTAGSPYNKVIYTIVKNLSSFSPVAIGAEGCNWTIQFEDNTNISMPFPSDYAGTQTCAYNSLGPQYDVDDAFQGAINNLLQKVDLDSNGKVDLQFDTSNLAIDLTEITGIPFTWSTEVQVRTWR